MYVTEIESPYHTIITVSSYMIEISRLQVIMETEKINAPRGTPLVLTFKNCFYLLYIFSSVLPVVV